jgi:uncharacterized protein (DUF58 family)
LSLRQAAITRLRGWSARRHGADRLPVRIVRRRIYILPTRFGLLYAGLLGAMLLAALNYNSNLALAFAFLLVSVALVAMHHCHRNLLNLSVDAQTETDAITGTDARFQFRLRNESALERRDIEIHAAGAVAIGGVTPGGTGEITLAVPVSARGVTRWPQFELRTRHPFGWFRAWTYVQGTLTAFVAPRPAGNRPLPAAAGEPGRTARGEIRGDEDFAGLRAYVPGVPLKHMAWKVLARGGEPAVRSYTGPAARPQWLEWSALEGLGTEARLSQLCRWVLQSEGNQSAFGLRLPGVEVAPGRGAAHRSACLRALAAFSPAAAPAAAQSLAPARHG